MKKYRKYLPYLIISIVAIISMLPLLIKSNVWGHDTNFHLANIKDLSESISISNPLPKISTQIGNGLGYGTHLFYAPLPHYIGGYLNIIFNFLNLGVDNCLVFIYLVISILSGIVIYIYANELTKNKYTSLLSSIIFLLMPYRMGDIIVRSSYNEVFIFLFVPMILLSLNRFLNRKKFLLLFVCGYVGLILSHLVMAFYTSLFLIIWIIINKKKIFIPEKLKKISVGVLIVSIMVLPFIILMLSQKNGNYLIFLDGYMTDINYMDFYSLNLKDFIVPLNDYSWDVPYFINFLVITSFFISVFSHLKSKRKERRRKLTITYLIILTFICTIMCLKIFPWKTLPDFFYMIQFPWRLMTFITIAISIIAPLWILKLKQKDIILTAILFAILLVITEAPFIQSMTTYKYLIDDKINYNNGMGHSKEYLPVNTYENIEYFDNRGTNIKCSSCNSNIIKNINHKFKFEINTTEEQVIEIPRIYYIGYKLVDSNNNKVKFYENDKGFISFVGSNDTYTLTYVGPTLYRIAKIVRTITLIGIISYNIYPKIKKKK